MKPRKKFVIRVRAETDQFLLSCNRIETFVIWLQSLFVAIDLAPPLDERQIPRDLSIPQPRQRRRPREGCVRFHGNVRNGELVRDQVRIMERYYPHMISSADITADSDDSQDDAQDAFPDDDDLGPSSSQSSLARPVTAPSHPSEYVPSSSLSRNRRPRLFPNATEGRPSIDESGKWRPNHHWSARYDIMYAKRCMAVLMHRSPRKSNYVIMKGKQWVVDWATGTVTRCDPPGYNEIFKDGEKGTAYRVSQYGDLIRV